MPGQEAEVVAQGEQIVVHRLESELENADALRPLTDRCEDPPVAVDLGTDHLLQLERPPGQRPFDGHPLGLLGEKVDRDADGLEVDLLVVDDIQDEVVPTDVLEGGGDICGEKVRRSQ